MHKTDPDFNTGPDTADMWTETWNGWINTMDQLGVTVVVAAGNGGYDYNTGAVTYYTYNTLPGWAVTRESPVIMVGGVYPDGSLCEFSSPTRPGSSSEISIYSQASRVEAYIAANGAVQTDNQISGSSVATAQVVSLKLQPAAKLPIACTNCL